MARFVAAYESADLDSLVALLTDDVFLSMPPLPFEYEGREPTSRSLPASSARAAGSTSCQPERTVNRRSVPMCVMQLASVTGSASLS